MTGGIDSDSVYDIVLGTDENQQSLITRNDVVLISSYTPFVLSCYESRQFYVSWMDGSVAVHEQTEEGTQILFYAEPSTSPRYLTDNIFGLTFNTESDVIGKWDIPKEEGNVCFLLTK